MTDHTNAGHEYPPRRNALKTLKYEWPKAKAPRECMSSHDCAGINKGDRYAARHNADRCLGCAHAEALPIPEKYQHLIPKPEPEVDEECAPKPPATQCGNCWCIRIEHPGGGACNCGKCRGFRRPLGRRWAA